jgi:hypothetical protein
MKKNVLKLTYKHLKIQKNFGLYPGTLLNSGGREQGGEGKKKMG